MPPRNASQEIPPKSGSQDTTVAATERITVALIARAAEALQQLVASTGLSKTDIVNRALTLYEYIDSQTQAGNDLIIRDKKTGETETIRLL
jgi:hypothetical protein